MDSKLVVEQMSGRWQIKHPDLRPLAAQAGALVAALRHRPFGWIPRERNRRADALANKAMDVAAPARPRRAAGLPGHAGDAGGEAPNGRSRPGRHLGADPAVPGPPRRDRADRAGRYQGGGMSR